MPASCLWRHMYISRLGRRPTQTLMVNRTPMSARLAAMVAPMPGESTLNTGRGRWGRSVRYRLPSLWAASKRRRSWLTITVPGAPDMASLQQVQVESGAPSQLPQSDAGRG